MTSSPSSWGTPPPSARRLAGATRPAASPSPAPVDRVFMPANPPLPPLGPVGLLYAHKVQNCLQTSHPSPAFDVNQHWSTLEPRPIPLGTHVRSPPPRLVNRRSVSGFTALCYACWAGCETSARLLLRHGADMNLANMFSFDQVGPGAAAAGCAGRCRRMLS
jgi:hypothetical protein